MSDLNRQILMCVTDGGLREKVLAAARAGAAITRSWHPAETRHESVLRDIDCVFLQARPEHGETLRLVEACKRALSGTPILLILQAVDLAAASDLMRQGVFHCLASSASVDDFINAVRLAGAATTSGQPRPEGCSRGKHMLVGESPSVQRIGRIIDLIAKRRCTVLIGGETGTGKEMAARAIHLASDRSGKPMVSINCGAIPTNLMEAELFGHVKGAFTGAVANRLGKFEQAHGGTLFLDEIGELPLDLQPKLLRALQEREIQKLGSGETVKVDVRVIAASNGNLLEQVRRGKFREDLYYRLNVVPIQMPALRERSTDVALLVQHFIFKICESEELAPKLVNEEALRRLCAYNWPGNVRQLENMVEHAIVMSGERQLLTSSDFELLPATLVDRASGPMAVPDASEMPEDGLDYAEALRQFERSLLQQALRRAQGNKTHAADILKLPRTTLLHKLRTLEPMVA